MLRAVGGIVLITLLWLIVVMRFLAVANFQDSASFTLWLLPYIGVRVLLLGLVISAAGLVGLVGLRTGLWSSATFKGSTAATIRMVGEHIGIAATSIDPIRTVYFIGYTLTVIALPLLFLVQPKRYNG